MQRLTKRRIALIQMEQSLNLLANDPVSALTLAGVAEEIIGRVAQRKGHKSQVERQATHLGALYEWAGQFRPSRKQLIALVNKTRNELKHQDDGRNIKVEADFKFEAEEMLLRCLFNHVDAYGYLPASTRLKNWFFNMTL